jgi:quercetin dioxygenase-like cupin family protein
MNTTRFACRILAAGVVATVAACGQSAEPTTRKVSVHTASTPPSETLSPLFESTLPNVKGKTFTSAIVDFPPAARAVPHRHGGAFVYAYVLDGTVRSRLAGQPAHTYRQGQDWVEQPGADHVLTENVSASKPARLLVVFISTTGHRLKIDDPPRPAARQAHSRPGT